MAGIFSITSFLLLSLTGYTISFWMAILNEDLEIKDGVLVDGGGYRSSGMAVYWEDNRLKTKFKKKDGETWIVSLVNVCESMRIGYLCAISRGIYAMGL